MGRKNRRVREQVRPLTFGTSYGTSTATVRGTEYAYRHISAQRAMKEYVCPWCNGMIPPGIAHIVAWPMDDPRGAEDRRHWHSGCFKRS